MADADVNDDDLFADLYEEDEVPAPAQAPAPAPAQTSAAQEEPPAHSNGDYQAASQHDSAATAQYTEPDFDNAVAEEKQAVQEPTPIVNEHGFTGTVGIKEDGKMFIGGLNWETDEDSLKNYFSQFGEVLECTVMRDSQTNRSRGFGFLTFKDPKTVNIVMVKEHFLDGKIIDPKRAIPRDEQERTSKIFVGGVSQEATEQDFQSYFEQFGRVVDATLMMDKETGRPRGFGFVTFEGDEPVEACLRQPLEILGKPIEVKRAQPRGNIEEERTGKFGRGRFGARGQEPDPAAAQQQAQSGMSGFQMAQTYMRMQTMFQMMQQQMMAANMPGGGMANPMMQQYMMQQMQNQQRGQSGSPGPQGMNGMNPQMMQQMQMQQQQQQQQGGGPARIMSPMSASGRPGSASDQQQAFEQRKYEAQAARATTGPTGPQAYNGSQSSSWEGMYDDVPQPDVGFGVPVGPSGGAHPPTRPGGWRGRGRGGFGPQPSGQAPANAPTGPKNPGRSGGYRGGGRGGQRGFHPYNRH